MKKKPLLCVFAGANEGKNIKYKSETIKLAKCLSAYSFKFFVQCQCTLGGLLGTPHTGVVGSQEIEPPLGKDGSGLIGVGTQGR